MKKGQWNFIIDVVMFFIMALLTGLGLLIRYILIPGSERWLKYGKNVELSFLGLDRHEWGYVHFMLALVLLALLLLHIILHWNLIKGLFEKIVTGKTLRVLTTIIFSCVIIGFSFFPFFVSFNVTALETGKERMHSLSHERDTIVAKQAEGDMHQAVNDKKYVQEGVAYEAHHHNNIDPSIEVKGYMTVHEVSDKYNVPVDFIFQELNVPSSVSQTAKLGHLRKQYDFKMSELELIIAQYKASH